GRTDELPKGYETLIDLFPEQSAYRKLYAAYLIRNHKLEAARAQFAEIAKRSPGDADAALDLARMDYKIGGADAAKATFDKYISAEPKNEKLQFAYGEFLTQLKDYAGAKTVYDALAAKKSEPETVLRAKNNIAALLALEGKKDEAEALVDEILAADARNSDALIKRAAFEVDDGKLDDAVANLRTVLADKPDSVEAKLMMGAAFEKKGDIDFATSQMAQAVEASKNGVLASNVFARFLMRHNDPGRAEKVLRDSLAKYPDDISSLKLLASLQLMQQDWRGAQETAEAIEKASAEDPAVNRILGAAYSGLGDTTGAIDALSKANAQTPLSGRPLTMLVGAYVKDGKETEAENMLQGMIKSDPKNYEAIILLGQVYQREKKTDVARSTLRDAIAVDPNRLEAIELLYRDYMAAADRDSAQKLLDERLAAGPDNDGLKMLKADYLITTKQPEAAMNLYADVLTRRPKDLLASNNYAGLLSELKDDKASRDKALEVASVLKDSQNPYFLDTYGWALYRTGDYAGAVKSLETASEGAPSMTEITYHLGAAYAAAGDMEKARAALQKVIDAGDTPYLQKARDLLAAN
ncbi:MAG TPA: tetratricopeptide repeat protein, partial [Parvularculaceae bacterium]|nr:tetratricopeptide repeat protein [Parvularculaceae bacterium]